MSDEIETPPQLFVLRLWPVMLSDGRMEWRGRLHHTQTDKTRYFRDWPALIPLLLAMLRESNLPNEQPPMHSTWPEAPDDAYDDAKT